MAETDLRTRLQSNLDRTEAELEALGEGMASKPARPAAPKVVKRQPPVERAGMGRDLMSETTRAIIAGLDARLTAFKTAGNAAKVAELEAKKKAIMEEAQVLQAEQAAR